MGVPGIITRGRHHALLCALGLSVACHLGLGLLMLIVPVSTPRQFKPAGGDAVSFASDDEDDMPIQIVSRPAGKPPPPSLPPTVKAAPPLQLPRPIKAEPGVFEHGHAGSWPTTGQAGSSPNEPGSAGFFPAAGPGRSIVYLIDISSSMGPSGGLAAACRELLHSIRQLSPAIRFQILVYNHSVRPLVPRCPDWLSANPQHLHLVSQAAMELEAVGTTAHGPALQEALRRRPDVLFFLTDADDLTASQLQLASKCNLAATVIHVIELNPHNRGRPNMPLQILARENRGSYLAVDLAGGKKE